MTVKKILILSSSLLGIATATLIISLIIMNQREQFIKETQIRSHNSLLLAEELRNSSRMLTSSVEKYTVTGNERYAEEFINIIHVRNGEKPRPDDSESAPGQCIPLMELIKQSELTDRELHLVQQAAYLSDKLAILETEAINAVRGLFPDDDGNYTVIGEPDMLLARDLVFNQSYENQVAGIMLSLNIFNEQLGERLDIAVETAQADFDRCMRVVWVILTIFVIMFIAFILFIGFVIIRPILLCDVFAKKIAGGTFDTNLSYTSNNEIGSLASSLRSMVQTLIERIHLEEHARYFDAVIAAADAGVIITDKDFLITDWNDGAERILGYQASELIGKTAKVYTHENHFANIDVLRERLRNKEHIAHLETVRKHKNGQLIDCSASYTPIFDSDGHFNGSLCVFHNITEEKLAIQKARNLAAIVSIADGGIIIKDKDGIVTEWNAGAEKIFGYKAEEMIGKTSHYYAPETSYASIDNIEAQLNSGESIVRVDVERTHKNGTPVSCSSSYTPIFDEYGNFAGSVTIFQDISDKKRLELELQKAVSIAEEKHQTIMASIDYASKIQMNLLPSGEEFSRVFSDHSALWEPKDIVGGDIYWLKSFKEGTVLCICDCTGHGTPGALLTMLVASAFENIINDSVFKDTAEIIWMLEKRLVSVLHVNKPARNEAGGEKSTINDGCDLAVLFIATDGTVTISAGHTHVFVCDGKEVTQIKGQKLHVGDGAIKNKSDINSITVPANPDNKFYIASDGLFDQIGGEHSLPFGYSTFRQIILEKHNEKQVVISERVWEAFESYRGGEPRRDDIELITFKP